MSSKHCELWVNLGKPEGICNSAGSRTRVYREGRRSNKKEGGAAPQHRSQVTDTRKGRNEWKLQKGYQCCSCSICSPITTHLLTQEQQMSFWLKEDIKILRILNHLPQRCVSFQGGDYHPRIHSSSAKHEGAGVPQPVCFRSIHVCQLTQLPMYLVVGNQNNSSSMHQSPQPCVPGINE